MRQAKSGGGWQAIRYSLRTALKVGPLRFWRAMHAKNACKTCAFGMGGQMGGMRNEAGSFPEVCKKSMQAMAADMRGRIEPRLFETYSVEQFKGFSPREMEAFGRLADPVIARPGDTHFRPISWDDALDVVAASLKRTDPQRAFFYASGRSSSEAGFLLQLVARAYGTNHVNNCSYYCHQASGAGLRDSIGSPTGTIDLEDLEKCDLFFLIGGNPASNHPRLMAMLMKLRRRGGKVIVVNPARETGLVNFRVPSNVKSMLFGDEIASLYLQPTIGGDIALFAGIAKRLIELWAVDKAYVDASTEGFSEVKAYVERLSWSEIEKGSGLTQDDIEAAAEEYARSHRTIFAWAMGITHHEHGTENVQWIANLALMRGMVGKEGAGLMPIRGHSNVQGMGSVGVTPAMTKAAVEGLQSLGYQAPAFQGYDTMAAMLAAGRGEMSFSLCLGGNLFGANPDAAFAAEALGKLDTLVYLSTSLNTGHAHGLGKTTLILPVQARDEESQSTTQESMFSYVRLSDGGPQRFEGPRSETSIVAAIADRVLVSGGLEWGKLGDHEEIRRLIARLVPHLKQIESIGSTKKEFAIPGRVLHEPRFATPNGRAAFRAHPLPSLPSLAEGQLRLMTLRSEGQFNTVVYDEEDIYRGQERRDVILMNPADIAVFGLAVDQPVAVRSATGEMRDILVREFDIARGCAAMYYPEANILVPKEVDPRSKTPSFKSVVVTIERSGQAGVIRRSEVAAAPVERGSMKAC